MTAYKKLTNPDPNDSDEVVIAAGWNALEACGIGPELRPDGIVALRELQKPTHDALVLLQYLHRRHKELSAFIADRRWDLVGCTENSPEDYELKVLTDVWEKITGRPAS